MRGGGDRGEVHAGASRIGMSQIRVSQTTQHISDHEQHPTHRHQRRHPGRCRGHGGQRQAVHQQGYAESTPPVAEKRIDRDGQQGERGGRGGQRLRPVEERQREADQGAEEEGHAGQQAPAVRYQQGDVAGGRERETVDDGAGFPGGSQEMPDQQRGQ